MRTIGLAVLNVVISSIKDVFGGFVLACLWRWFIVTKFISLPLLSTGSCIGIMLVVDFLLCGLAMSLSMLNSKDIDSDDAPEIIVKSIVLNILMIGMIYPVTLGTCYVWHQFI